MHVHRVGVGTKENWSESCHVKRWNTDQNQWQIPLSRLNQCAGDTALILAPASLPCLKQSARVLWILVVACSTISAPKNILWSHADIVFFKHFHASQLFSENKSNHLSFCLWSHTNDKMSTTNQNHALRYSSLHKRLALSLLNALIKSMHIFITSQTSISSCNELGVVNTLPTEIKYYNLRSQ